jgi:WD40 repeat protein
MRKAIVVLGFFIIALILIAGCTSAQNSATAGSKNQNPSGNTNVKMTSAEPKAAPAWSYATKDPINSVAISADGQYVAAGSGVGNGNRIYYFSREGKLLWNYSSESCRVVGVSSDGQKVIIDDDQNIIYFSRDGKRLLEYPEGNQNYHYAISADGQYVFASGLSNKNRCSKYAGKRNSQGEVIMCSIPPLINLYGDKLLWSKEVKEEMADVAMSADGQYMASGKNTVSYYSRDGNLLWIKEVGAGIADVAMSADGQYIVTGTPRGGVYYFSQDGKLLWNYSIRNPITSVDISADGQYVVVGTDEGVGEIYYFSKNGTLFWKQTTESGESFVDMSADGQYVVARTFSKVYYFSHDGKLLWSQYAGSHSLTIANSIAISADGRNVIVGSHETYGESKVYFFSRD